MDKRLVLGQLLPEALRRAYGAGYASVNLVVAGADLGDGLPHDDRRRPFSRPPAGIGRKPKGLVITVVVNWLIKPFTPDGAGRAVLRACLRRADRPGGCTPIHRRC